MSTAELHAAARRVGLGIQHDCGGYRVVDGYRYLFPAVGICPTATRREVATWLDGFAEGRKHERKILTERKP